MVTRLVLVLVLAACGARTRGAPPSSRGGSADTEVTLYRDHAVVAHRVRVVIPQAATTTVKLRVAAGVDPANIYVVDKSELTVREVRVARNAAIGGHALPDVKPPVAEPEPKAEEADDDDDVLPKPKPEPADEAPLLPTDVEIELGGPRDGTFTLVLGYDTERIAWDAAYTMTTTPARDQALLRGAIAIRNATGIGLAAASLWIVDAEHGPATLRIAERIGSLLVGREGSTTPLAVPRHLGVADLVEGETRIELLASPTPQAMKSVLVYDPIGTALDHPGTAPLRDPALGVQQSLSSKVTESFEVARDGERVKGLPAGAVRLLERRPDGSLALLGESRIFDASTRIAAVDTIAVGTADGVTGKRERRELTIDEDRKRLAEEFVVTIENARERPVEVVLREHFYRGQNWALAYQSIPLQHAAKEGSQQVIMRIVVPGKQAQKPGRLSVLYVAVYTW